jgi:hypothetical protein
VVAIRVYVEGGGDRDSTIRKCRQGFSEFLRKAMPPMAMPRIIACGGRSQAFDRFRTAMRQYPDKFCVLLVDSERPVPPGENLWNFLEQNDNWSRPHNAAREHVHLMVQLMEAWFLADKPALERFYGHGFNVGALPARTDIENISKSDVLRGLELATRNTRTKGAYRKSHGFDILASLDPDRVRSASPDHAGRLFQTLSEKASS